MKTSQVDILILPSLGGPDDDLWLSRWERKLHTARIIDQPDWHAPQAAEWVARLGEAVAQARRPVILVAHGLGCHVVARAVACGTELGPVVGAYLVAPTDPESMATASPVRNFGPPALSPLPFPSVLIAAQNNPHCTAARARDFAEAWGAEFVDAGESGSLDAAAGFGPWPEGLMRFAGFLKSIPTVQ
jgi:predicted alpha/beta hydrolase family esterase